MSLKNRSFLKLLDYTPAEIEELLDLAADLKARKKAGIRHNEQLAGKNIALIFEKTSTRTRCREHFGSLKGIHFVYFGDARYNMGNSLMVGCAKMGLHFTACAPKKYQPDAALIAQCQAIAAETGATLTFEEDPAKAAQGADVLYTDVWVSMGEPIEVWAERIHDLAPYQINQELMNIAGPKAVFMHCLPAYHDHKTAVGKEMGERFGRDAMEVTDEVFEGPQSIVFDEAENRMHTIKAVMAATLGYQK